MKKLLLLLFFLQIGCTYTVANRFSDNIAASDEDSTVIDDDVVVDAIVDADFFVDDDVVHDKDATFDEDLIPDEDEIQDEPKSAFITTWKTDNGGISKNNQIKIMVWSDYYDYDYSIDCDNDGVVEAEHQKGEYICEYEKPGTYTVSITGLFPGMYFEAIKRIIIMDSITIEYKSDNPKLLSIDQWGSSEWKTMSYAFNECSNLSVNAIDTPDLSNVLNLTRMFYGVDNFNQNISSWDVSRVTKMNGMFSGADSFNQDIGSWNVSNVTKMSGMFAWTDNFNQDIGSWDVSNVTSMSWMFRWADSFNQDISSVKFPQNLSKNEKIRSNSIMLVHNQTENGMNGENRHFLPQAYDCVSNRGLR